MKIIKIIVLPRRRNVDVTINVTMYHHDTLSNIYVKHTNNKNLKMAVERDWCNHLLLPTGVPIYEYYDIKYHQNESSNITIITNNIP